MRNLFTILFISLFLISCGKPSLECVSGDCINGLGTYKYSNGDEYSGQYKDGKRDGEGIYIYSEGSKFKGLFNEDLREKGIFTDLNGEKYQVEFKDDTIIVGKVTIYYKNGNIKGIENYNDGILHGPVEYYYEDGTISTRGEFKNGLKNNEWVLYHNNEKISTIGTIKDGVEIGKWSYYDVEGNLSLITHYNGRDQNGNYNRHGEMISFYKNGQREVELNFDNGQVVGQTNEYYDDGKIRGKGFFKGGFSKWDEYYKSGSIKETGTYYDVGSEERKKVNKWIYYNQDGTVKETKEY